MVCGSCGTDAPAGFDIGRAVDRDRPRRSYEGLIGELCACDVTDTGLERILAGNAHALFALD